MGSTQDLERRMKEHRRGSCHTTRRLGGEIVLLAEQRCASLDEARALECRLKRMKNPRAAIDFVRG
ncbi:MAG: GIY-YIG nuclease family protein [Chthoniobacterales bacterium]